MATPEEDRARFQEIANRGIQDKLPPEIRARFDEAVARNLVSMPQAEQSKKTNDGYGLNLFREGLQGLTLNTSDEIGAAIAAGVATVKDGANFKEAFNDILGNINQEQDAFREENPKAAFGAQVVGGLATGGAGLAKVAAKTAGKGVVSRLAANTAVGATEGAIAGYAGAEGADRATSGVVGAAVGGTLGAVGGEAMNFFTKRSALKKEVSDLLQSGSTDRKVARYMLDGAGKAKKDPIAIEAVRQGVDEGVVAMLKGASRSDRANMRRMLTVVERSKENAREGAVNRSTDVIGGSLVQRIKVVDKAKRAAGHKLNRVVKDLEGKPVAFHGAVDEFIADLDDMGVSLIRDDNGVIRPNFEGSAVENLAGVEAPLKRIIERMQRSRVDAKRAHDLKRYIDENVSYGKIGGAEGLTGNTERVLKKLRHNLNEALNQNYDEYKAANKIYSETKGALDAIQDAAGSKIDTMGEGADKALGTLSNSLLSNIRSRVGLANSIDDLSKIAAKHGGQFDDDIITQAVFADELDALFGAQAKRSLQGETEKAVRNGLSGGVKEAAIDMAAKGVDKARNVNQEAAFNALRRLLEDKPGTSVLKP